MNLAPCLPVDLAHLPENLRHIVWDAPTDAETKGTCEDCKIDVWVGPRKRALFEIGAALIVCYGCAEPRVVEMAKSGVIPVVDLAPGQRRRT